MAEITFLYKCRRCGEISRNPRGDEINAIPTLVKAMNNIPDNIGMPVFLMSIHPCKDGGHGVTDLIGYEPVEDKP